MTRPRNHLLYINKKIGIDCALTKAAHQNQSFNAEDLYQELIMHAKFPFYSIAQLYALSLNAPVAIMLGGDNLYWVVDQHHESEFLKSGCALLSHAR